VKPEKRNEAISKVDEASVLHGNISKVDEASVLHDNTVAVDVAEASCFKGSICHSRQETAPSKA
jgi:hypothetical protein